MNFPKLKPKRILYRIIVPFTLLFGLTTLSTWFFSAYFISRYLDQNLKQQMEQVTGLISQFPYVQNPAILRQLKEVINAEIVIFDKDGRIAASTFTDIHSLEKARITIADLQTQAFVGRTIQLNGVKYQTIIHSLATGGKESAFLSLWMPTDTTDAFRQRIVLSIGGIALLGILAMAGIGFYIARSITSPLEALVRVTSRVSGGERSEKVRMGSDDEVGTLADAFNLMIDELRRYEDRLVKSEKLATAGQMAAGLAHEIRNPLTSIKMLGQVLQKRLQAEPDNREMLMSLVREIDRLDRIIKEMLDRTRPGGLNKRLADVNGPVGEVIRVAEEGLIAGHIVIEPKLTVDLPAIYLDQEKIKQVLWNLILNAKEAMPGGGNLILSTTMTDTGSVEIVIADTGRGISVEGAEHLFQPFFTTKPEGLGLGLTMSRKIIEQHGGTLSLESRPNGGTIARIVLPVHMES